MKNMAEFVEKAIGASITVRYLDGDQERRDTFVYIIKDIEEQPDGSYLLTTRIGDQFRFPDLETIEGVLNGTPYYEKDYTTYKVIISACK